MHGNRGPAISKPPVPHIESLLREGLRRAGTPVAEILSCTWEQMDTGYSSARLTRAHLTVRSPGSAAGWRTRLVVKRVDAAGGWLGWATEDHCVREVQLWRAGILDRLPRGIASPVLVAEQELAADGAVVGGTLVMRDVRACLLSRPYIAPPDNAPLLALLADRLARLHARFWQNPALRDPQLGLMPPRPALLLAAPDTIARRLALGDQTPYLGGMIAAWDAFLDRIPGEASAVLVALLRDLSWIESAVGDLPFTLVHGDTWGPNIGVRQASRTRADRTIELLDWGLACAAPCTYDPLWLCATWPALNPIKFMARYRTRLALYLGHRGVSLEGATWLRLLDIAYLRTVLTGGEAFGRALLQAKTPSERARALTIARWWAARAAIAAERLPGRAA